MNIGIIHGFVGGGGGTEKTLHGIIDALEQTDHNVTLYTFSKPLLKTKKIKIKSMLPINIPFFGLYQRVMESKLLSKAQNEDVLIQTSGGLGIPKNKNQKIIVYCHSDFSNELKNPATKYKGLWSIYYKSYYNTVKAFIENIQDSRIHLISNSQYTHDLIKNNFAKNSKIIYPPVDLKEFSVGDKQNKVVTVSRFSNEKNLEFGINVMKEINEKYEIIGNTKTKSNLLYYKKLKTKIKHENLTKIKMMKNIPRNALVGKISESKVYFHCSRETFGISTIEGIAAGCIPIVPDIGGHLETVPYPELRYEENNLQDAQEKVRNALTNSFNNLESLRNSIKKYDRQEFTKQIISYIESI